MSRDFSIFRAAITARFLSAILILLVFGLAGCGSKSDTGNGDAGSKKKQTVAEANSEYQLLQAELKLASTKKVYLEIRFDLKELRLKIEDAVVWDYPLDFSAADSDDVREFVNQFSRNGTTLVRPLGETYLFAAREKTPDSILAIVSEVTKFKPELMQRELPQRFQLRWGDNVILDVHTDVHGKPISKLKNTMLEVRHVLQSTIGEAHLSVKMDQVHAMTLFRVSEPGLPTIVYPPA
jgi:hypothetical protein